MRDYRSAYYSVHPRYSPGSPAAVDAKTAMRVAANEVDGYYHALDGIYGIEDQERANRLGLSGIIEVCETFAHHIEYYDRLTGEHGTIKHVNGIRQKTKSTKPPRHFYETWSTARPTY